jgi:DNA-binding NarL/FixJ family response regulator
MKLLDDSIQFTASEIEILNYIKKGFSSAEIAVVRCCSKRTIEKHRSNIIAKLNIPPSQNALLLWLFKNP